jgi:hypothetical protein
MDESPKIPAPILAGDHAVAILIHAAKPHIMRPRVVRQEGGCGKNQDGEELFWITHTLPPHSRSAIHLPGVIVAVQCFSRSDAWKGAIFTR